MNLTIIPQGEARIKWIKAFLLSLIAPVILLVWQPLGMNLRQTAVVAAVLLTIIWWTSNLVAKIPASLFLLLVFWLVSGAPPELVFSFPLSSTFPLLVFTYLFSYAASSSGLVEKLVAPRLRRIATNPVRLILAMLLVYLVTIVLIPQPLARLILVTTIFDSYLKETQASTEAIQVFNFSAVLYYILVNMLVTRADLIMNNATLSFAGLTTLDDLTWFRYMGLPSLVVLFILTAGIFVIFRKELQGVSLKVQTVSESKQAGLTTQEKTILAIVLLTVILWMTESLHGLSGTWVTLASTLVLFMVGALKWQDWKAIDVKTLVFLSAAFAIGGVLKNIGAADLIFSQLKLLFPATCSPLYFIVMILITMAIHMLLGSNTTTLSVVIPGLLVASGDLLPAPIIMFTAYASVAYHAILPVHSVAFMIGAEKDLYPTHYVTRFGLFSTLVVYLSILLIYLPWWRLIGVI
ncbi:MAG: anion permease [Eubacteriales bacterium]|nr:anion permease [Eubacteriales bacterium]